MKADFEYKDGLKIYFTSDTHFNHEHILKFCDRPFKDVSEMNERLIEKWNEKVPSDGLVFHLGDFSWGGYEKWRAVRDRLNGDIILIKGNHDTKNMTSTAEKELFKHTAWQMSLVIEGRSVILNHYPFLCYAGVYRNPKDLVYQLHGHVHYAKNNPRGLDIERVSNYEFSTQYDVGVDLNDFAPMSWYEVDEKIQMQIEENDNMKIWLNEKDR